YKNLPETFKKMLLYGSGEQEVSFTFWRAGKISKVTKPFEGIIPNLERLYQESESEFTRNRLKAFMAPQFCDACDGKRLKPEILAVRLGNDVPTSANGSITVPQVSEIRPAGNDGQKKLSTKAQQLSLPGLSIMDV